MSAGSDLIPTVKVRFTPSHRITWNSSRTAPASSAKQGMRHFKSRCRHEPFLCTFHIVSQHLARTLVRNDNRSIDRLIRKTVSSPGAPVVLIANAPAANVSATGSNSSFHGEILSIV